MKLKGMMMVTSLMALSFCWVGCDDDDDDDSLSQQDKTFIEQVSMGNRAEIELGQLAATNSTTADVRNFGLSMASEHQTAQDELRELADDKDATFKNELDAEHQALKTRLSSLTGYQFDTAYINSQVRDHQKTLTIFNTQISSGKDRQVKDYANKYQPHIQMHFNEATEIKNSLGQ
ncbi:DUF4142 domain-containing protein [Chryseosolibacter indicus]|uniref:DUF4142 domain-containing protein n=1 Tax=Chryseosolibacter indicus TaxID=2782351 RepID=A0ABS5VK04_9BACT|nr:DUF4142 domain-containing protein [Chryseosolibacter indicus]MBT1701772.1 DUF4142 domain-containing protein [Chryseosolibacter indicus]